MKKFLSRVLMAAAAMLAGVAAPAAPFVAGEAGSFVFTDTGYFADKPLTVHYYRAKGAGPAARVLFSMHGVERNAKRARDNWIEAAERNGLVVLAPEFDQARFPRRLYQMGGMEEADSAKWTFGLIERIFDAVRAGEGLTASGYTLFGHSAGAQFTHRFALVMGQSRLERAVTANAGSYTMPLYPGLPYGAAFPWTLDGKRVPADALRTAFGRPLLVLLGEKDTDTGDPDLPKSPEAMAQGAHRLERGRKFFAEGQTQAARMGAQFRWQLTTVPDTGHNSRAMSRAAAKALFGEAAY